MNTPCQTPYKPILFIDSGAWSAYTSGQPVDLAQYCDFLHKHMEMITLYAALDWINPGSGRLDTEHAAAEGFKNWKYMQSRGLAAAIPVIHQGEDFKWIRKYLEEGVRYIGLSATSLAQKTAIDNWYTRAWAHLVNKDGLPIVQVHAFGDTREIALRRFPWASCDSSSWIYSAQIYGGIRIDDAVNPFARRTVMLSQRTDGRHHSETTPDIDSLDTQQRSNLAAMLRSYGLRADVLDERVAFTQEKGTNLRREGREQKIAHRTILARSIMSIKYYQRMAARVAAQYPKRLKRDRGFVESVIPSDLPVDPDYTGFRLYLALGGNLMSCPLLWAARHVPILASYFYMHDKRLNEVVQFMRDPDSAVHGAGPWQKYTHVLNNDVFASDNESTRPLQTVSTV